MRRGCGFFLWLFNLFMNSMVRGAMETFVGGCVTARQKEGGEKDEDVEKMLNEVKAKWKRYKPIRGKLEYCTKGGGGTCDMSVKGKKLRK